ncbi:MAG: PHP domain-containing protein [Clostridia bacterium]|nr:PHP domain-containing protein [Clostridia bacterium]
MKADLHLHTTVSDGTLTPEEIVRQAAAQGFEWIAVTDHDSVDGIAPAVEAGRRLGVHVIPAAELSCGTSREIHILGYGFNPQSEALRAYCSRRRESRIARAREMCALMTQCGKPVDFERVLELAGGVVGRPHVARALMEAGHVRSIREAFDRYLTPGKPGFVPRESVMAEEAIGAITKACGVAVLAHPMELRMGDAMIESLIGQWKEQGLGGLEVYHPSAANNQAAFLLRLARREGLLVTGGSDYHGETVRPSRIGEGLERWTTVKEDLQQLLERICAGSGCVNNEQ